MIDTKCRYWKFCLKVLSIFRLFHCLKLVHLPDPLVTKDPECRHRLRSGGFERTWGTLETLGETTNIRWRLSMSNPREFHLFGDSFVESPSDSWSVKQETSPSVSRSLSVRSRCILLALLDHYFPFWLNGLPTFTSSCMSVIWCTVIYLSSSGWHRFSASQ